MSLLRAAAFPASKQQRLGSWKRREALGVLCVGACPVAPPRAGFPRGRAAAPRAEAAPSGSRSGKGREGAGAGAGAGTAAAGAGRGPQVRERRGRRGAGPTPQNGGGPLTPHPSCLQSACFNVNTELASVL